MKMAIMILYKGDIDEVYEDVKGIKIDGQEVIITYDDKDFGRLNERISMDDDTEIKLYTDTEQ